MDHVRARNSNGGKVFVIGVDGATFDIILPLVDIREIIVHSEKLKEQMVEKYHQGFESTQA